MNTAAGVSGAARGSAPEALEAAALAAAGQVAVAAGGVAKPGTAGKAGTVRGKAAWAASATAPAKKAKPAPKAKVKSTGDGAVKLPSKGYASASKAATPYSFLSDPSLSVEEKLILLLATQKKKADAEIEGILKKAEEQKAQAAKKSGGLLGSTKVFDVAKTVIPALGVADKFLGGKLDDLLKQVSGPMLAAAASAAGFPALAPVAMQLGPKLADAVLDAKLPGGSDKSTSAERKGQGGELDSVELARVKLLQDRMAEWTSLASNMMQSIHQSRMNVIQNLR